MTATVVDLDAKLPPVELPVKEKQRAYETSFHSQKQTRSPGVRTGQRRRSLSPTAQKSVMERNLVAIAEWADDYDESAEYYIETRAPGDKRTGAVETAMAGILRGATRQDYPVAFLYERLTHLKLMTGELEDVLDSLKNENEKNRSKA